MNLLLHGYGPGPVRRRSPGRPPGGGKAPEVLRMVNEAPLGIRSNEIAKALGISYQLAEIHLRKSSEKGLIVKVSRGLWCSPEKVDAIKEAKQAKQDELVKLYESGQSVRVIAESTGLTYTYVNKTLHDAGVELRGKELIHGTFSGYVHHRCRCPECTDANTVRIRKSKADRRAAGKEPPVHGASGYSNYGCKCDVCLEATRARVMERIRANNDGAANKRKPWTPEDVAYATAKQPDGRRYLRTALQCAIDLERTVSSVDAMRSTPGREVRTIRKAPVKRKRRQRRRRRVAS